MQRLRPALFAGITNTVALCASTLASGQDMAPSDTAPSHAASKDSPPPAGENVAWAENESPELLMARGIEFRKRREDRLALAAFERAWTLGGAPRALAQLALAEQALGFWREAHEHLENALSHSDDPWISEHRVALRVALEEIASRLGTVEISCNVDGAEVKIDGRVVGRTPLGRHLRLIAGKSVVEVLVDGYFDMARQVQVDAGGISRVNFNLTPITSGPAAAMLPMTSSGPAASRDLLAPRAPMPLSVSTRRDQGESGRNLLTYTSTALAAVGATVGVTGYVLREVNVRLYNDDARCARQLGTPRSVECGDEFSAWQRGELIAIAGSSAAGVFGLTALYLWLSRPEAEAELSCAVGTTTIVCGSAF